MGKKCIICFADADYCIKGVASDCYCEECAIEQFGDVTYLVKVEDEAKRLKSAIDAVLEGSKRGDPSDAASADDDPQA